MIALLALTSSLSVAAITYGDTPEWLAHRAALIFEGVPQHVETKPLIGDQWLTSAQFRISKRIKGPLDVGDLITVVTFDSKDRADPMDLAGAVARKRITLVLATIAEHSFPETDGRYIFLRHFWNCPVFYADEPVKWIYTETGSSIEAYADLLRRIEAQTTKETALIQQYWPGKIVRHDIEAKYGTDAFKQLYALSAVFVRSIEYQGP